LTSAKTHEVIRASRNGDTKVNLDDPATIRALLETAKDVDALVSCAGNAPLNHFLN
jgi:NAD(P)-dependent dehydrogenase (short-subunit alcohol dehydrogenase family)